MGQRQALLITTFLTVFGLVLIGAVAMRLTADSVDIKQVESTTITDTLQTTDAAVVSTPSQDAVNALIASREQAYQEALNQANQQLQEAYGQLQVQDSSTGAAVPAAPVVGSQPASGASPYAVSPEQATLIAASLALGATTNDTPELVSFAGAVAYEVNTSAGLIYVDANTGTVLYNGAAPAPGAGGGATVPLPPLESNPAAPQISADQAVAAARAYVGGGDVERVKLEEERGALVYEVRFTNDNRVYVDARTGQVLSARIKDEGGDDDRNDD